MTQDRCPECGWTWLRANCREGKDETGRSYCYHLPCPNRWHDQAKPKLHSVKTTPSP